MIVTHKLHPMDFTNKGVTQRIEAVQDDKYSRNIEFTLIDKGAAWPVPDDTSVLINYKKGDGTGGCYDTLPDGTIAYTVDGNVLTVAMAPQVCTAPGLVHLAVCLLQGNAEINTYTVIVIVHPKPGVNLPSEDYINVGSVVTAANIKAALGYTPANQDDVIELEQIVAAGLGYKLTSADKAEIASLVDNATFVQTPQFVDSVEEMTEHGRVYVLNSTGTIWRSVLAEHLETVTENINGTGGSDVWVDSSRLSASSGLVTGGSYAGYCTTPYIDVTKYPIPFTIHLDGGTFIPVYGENHHSWIALLTYNADYTKLTDNAPLHKTALKNTLNIPDENVTRSEADGNGATIRITEMVKTTGGAAVKYFRFSGKATVDTARVYITYEQTVTGYTWVDTGVPYGTGLDEDTLAKLLGLNNEGNDHASISLLPAPVLAFYNAAAYSDSDYSYTHMTNTTFPCRADIPVPYKVKWNHCQDAMRTTVAVDTKAIGTFNKYTMMFYDATGCDSYPLYNLLPGTRYYYKVTHLMADGSLVEAKSGSFVTSDVPWRLLYIDGTQNVRDLGGWAGLDGRKVKYGKIIRGASLSDSSNRDFTLTGKGKQAFGELKVQAELNLGDTSTESAISSTCSYKKLYYGSYAEAITDTNTRTAFKNIFEWIVSKLNTTNIYIHCQGGCDRTGTLSFLLLGLLGVSESDLAKEYELSCFSSVGVGRYRNKTKDPDVYDYAGMVQALKAYSGSTMTDKFVNFATTGCGVSTETIEAFRALMLE